VRGDVESLSANRKGKEGAGHAPAKKSSFVTKTRVRTRIVSLIGFSFSSLPWSAPRRNLPGGITPLGCAQELGIDKGL
jgi:hypothetical protein